jgi:hypothetical protein
MEIVDKMEMIFTKCIIGILLATTTAQAQVSEPIKWSFSVVHWSESEASLICIASLEDDWHMYSQFTGTNGPMPTMFTFHSNADYSLIGKVKEESAPARAYDDTYKKEVFWFTKNVVFSQRIKLHSPSNSTVIKGWVDFMIGKNGTTQQPSRIEFSVAVKYEKPVKNK